MNATCAEEVRLPDPWISTHTLLPLALVALARIEPSIVVLLAYVWESVESVAFLCWTDWYEHPLNSIVLDPAAALLGIIVGRALAPARGYRRVPPRSELASTALLCLPSTLLWTAEPPPTALFTVAWWAAVGGTFRAPPADGDPPLSDASRLAIVAFAIVHVASVARVEWGHLWNGALAALAAAAGAAAAAAAAPGGRMRDVAQVTM